MLKGTPVTTRKKVHKLNQGNLLKIDTVEVTEHLKDITTYNVTKEDIKSLLDKVSGFLTQAPKDFKYLVPKPDDFSYPDPKPYDYPVPIPKINIGDLRESFENTVQSVFAGIDKKKLLGDILPEKMDIPQKWFKELFQQINFKDMMKDILTSWLHSSLSKIDLKAMLIEALGEIDMPIPKKVEGERIEVPQIVKGRKVIEHEIVKRESVVTLKGYRVVDDEGEAIDEFKPGIEVTSKKDVPVTEEMNLSPIDAQKVYT